MRAICLSALVLAGGCESGPVEIAVEGKPSAAEAAAFDQLLTDSKTLVAKSYASGASIAIVLHGKLVFAAGVGVRNSADDTPVTTSTRFRAGSMSKMIVAATAMTLVEEGKLDLDAPITTYLPWFELRTGFDPSQITTAALLSHTSGFPSATIGYCGPGTNGSREMFFADSPQPLWAPPGAVYDYANAGFSLAATVIEAAAGASEGDYDQMAHDRVLAPAGMTAATFDAVATTGGDHATGYIPGAAGQLSTTEPSDLHCAMLDAPGGIAATATDYAHFAEVLLADGGSVLAPSSVAAMEAPHVSTREVTGQAYGYGLESDPYPYLDHESIWHSGEVVGYSSILRMVPDYGLGVVERTGRVHHERRGVGHAG